ncbi:NUDIX hydrolase [Actinokineospora auranticolor]|uniref:ADP-ribose pyrophosphatase YjhB (NUDIX family) n=1 Tax=Actinokineospora auranticolor TaxID=155976 RepID=A0A2S6GKS4_9PSEU|nr:NUDIX hydrolase [Actinokineospora auranticolor]PPK65844.1 ADP-ribose pyrophosphatase YjhB (NUDIX family) [Actinokineospora auranticolor]
MPYDEYARSLPLKRVAAGVLFHDQQGRVLLVEPTYKDDWEIPGGTADAEEAPWATAGREAQEEVGIVRRQGALLVVDHIPTQGVMPEGLAFVFDGGLVTEDEVRRMPVVDPEIRSIGLYTVDEASKLVTPALHRRIVAAQSAVERGRTVLCDAGQPVLSEYQL